MNVLSEYSIEVSLTPTESGYFWCVFNRDMDGNKFNCGHGYGLTSDDAWKQAKKWYLRSLNCYDRFPEPGSNMNLDD